MLLLCCITLLFGDSDAKDRTGAVVPPGSRRWRSISGLCLRQTTPPTRPQYRAGQTYWEMQVLKQEAPLSGAYSLRVGPPGVRAKTGWFIARGQVFTKITNSRNGLLGVLNRGFT